MNTLDTEISNQLLSLPPEIQKAFSETDISGEVEKIRVKFRLGYDQATCIQTETLIAFLGLDDPKNLTKNISVNARIPSNIAADIVADIDAKILKGVKTKIIELLEKEAKEEEDSDVTDETILQTKDEILKEIEDPEPAPTYTANPVLEVVKKAEELALKREATPETPTTSIVTTPITTIETKAPDTLLPIVEPTRDIVAIKLSEPTRIPPQQTTIPTPTPQAVTPLPTQKNIVDPYKEPIA